jgi:DNA-binding NarL/FixJ family response regulator
LILAQEMHLRARIARALHSNGYAAELASDAKGALKLASERRLDMAIVAPGSGLAGLAMARQLRDAVPKILVLAEGSEKMARLRHSLPEADAFLKSSSEKAVSAEIAAVPAAHLPAPVATTLWIEGFFAASSFPTAASINGLLRKTVRRDSDPTNAATGGMKT